MGEVLRFEYDARGTVFVQVNPIIVSDEGVETVMIGPPPPETRPTLEELQSERPDLAAAVRVLLTAEPFWRTRATRKLKDPDALQELANQTSREAARIRADRERLAAERADAEAVASKAKEEADAAEMAKVKADAQRIVIEAEHAELDAQLAAKRAELALLEEQAVQASKGQPVATRDEVIDS